VSKLENLVSATNLTAAQIEVLNTFSKGFWNCTDFVKHWGISPRGTLNFRANGLGLREEKKTNPPYIAACGLLGIRNCDRFGQDLGISYLENVPNRRNADNQMRKLSVSKLPLVFFVPPDLANHQRVGLTYEEMKWLIRNPELAPPTHFVFGLHDFMAYSYIRLLATTR
jgi:hypothetical protein